MNNLKKGDLVKTKQRIFSTRPDSFSVSKVLNKNTIGIFIRKDLISNNRILLYVSGETLSLCRDDMNKL